jgi:hypothetical protein
MGWDLMGQTVLANAMVQRMVGYGKAVAYNDWFRAILMDFLFLGVAAAFVVSVRPTAPRRPRGRSARRISEIPPAPRGRLGSAWARGPPGRARRRRR